MPFLTCCPIYRKNTEGNFHTHNFFATKPSTRFVNLLVHV